MKEKIKQILKWKYVIIIAIGIFIAGFTLFGVGLEDLGMVLILLSPLIPIIKIIVFICRKLGIKLEKPKPKKMLVKEEGVSSISQQKIAIEPQLLNKKDWSKYKVKCPFCKAGIPADALRCSQCTTDLTEHKSQIEIERQIREIKKRGIAILVSFVFIIGLVIWVSLSILSTLSPEKPSPEKIPTIYFVNQDVRVGDVRWKVLEVKDLGSRLKGSQSRYSTFQEDVITTGKFIKVRFEVENLGKELKSVTWLRLVDSQSREYVPYSGVSAWIPEKEDLFLIENLNPNIPKTLAVIFDVAKDASGLKFRATDLRVLGAGVKEVLIDLGL